MGGTESTDEAVGIDAGEGVNTRVLSVMSAMIALEVKIPEKSYKAVYDLLEKRMAVERRDVEDRLLGDLSFLADARAEYVRREPMTANDMAEMAPIELSVWEEVTATRQLIKMLQGEPEEAGGWLPSWHWETWRTRRQGRRRQV